MSLRSVQSVRKNVRKSVHMLAQALALALIASACASTPELPTYKAAPGPEFANAPATQAEPVAQFWRGFGDAELDALVELAIKANPDLRSAGANLREARALASFADAQSAPTVAATASAARARARDSEGRVQTQNLFGAGFDVAWEADLFGRISGERQAALAQVLASEALVRAAQVSVASEVARNYFELRGLQEQLQVAQAALETQRAALKVVDARLEVGRGSGFDSERANALVQTTAATIPAFETTLIRTRYRLAVLTGQMPTALDARLAAPRPLPGIAPVALGAIGSPENLLRRRPDVAGAEQQVAAAAARIGIARSQLFPRLTLGGTIGLNAARVGELGDSASFAYNLGASLLWTLFDFGRNRAQIAAASARGEAAVIAYEKTVLGALEETEGALAAYTRTQRQTESLFDAARSAGKAADIARARFGAGTSDFLAVLDAERDLLAARDRLAQSNTAGATSLVAVYKSLAGGWKPP
jgi:outer membrane protein, multidrug efflux system